ncbi:zinc-ribbon family protein [Chitinophaga sp. CF118]|uniref:zinc-ribbon domain-containing protein n=1 Tax=Chitinophaga sp. CF118 TaxID=1884367 RepID=UPI0008E91BD7|nr:zinc-ribbon domain-containing protein [Chitinophaga sp. CF118]SFD12425.1 zinc-ribbon family protein [Chitinophaga sp. CF118]
MYFFFIYGKKKTHIKSDTNHEYVCQNCNHSDLDVHVYREYFHLLFLPIIPVGAKEVKIRCNNCEQLKWIASLEKHYEKTSRTPFYLYTGLGILIGLILFAFIAGLQGKKENILFVENPHVGDVYTIKHEKKDSTSYYFFRIAQIEGDSVSVYHNNLIYYGYVSKFNEQDFFMKDEKFLFTKKMLKEMLEKGEIDNVDRDYGVYEGFNRIQ